MAFLRRNNNAAGGSSGGSPSPQDGMTTQYAPRVGDLTVGDYANGMPNIRLAEMFKSFGRQLRWMVPLLIIGMVGAWFATKDFKRTYTGDGRILVQLGDEYVYQSTTGQQGNQVGLQLTPDTIVLNEIGIIKNSEIIDQVIGEMTATQAEKVLFDKKAFAEIASARTDAARQEAYMELRQSVEDAFVVIPRPKSSVMDLVYKHENGEVAVKTLNAFIDAYMSYRRQIFVEGAGDIISERRSATEEQLKSNERASARLLSKNNISDFMSEQTGAQKRTEELRAALNTLRAQMAESETALVTVEGQLRGTDQTIDLYVEDRASQRVAQAELELKQLLAKYLPTSNPVRQKQLELSELKSLQSSYGGKATGGRRVGPNPNHQALLTQRNSLQASADGYREKEFILQRQLNAADAKVRKLSSLLPQYQNLLRERKTLSSRLDLYNAKEQEASINKQQAESNSENIRVISYAKYPTKGQNTRLVMFALATVAWGFTLFMFALLKVFLDPRLYANPESQYQGSSSGYDMARYGGSVIPEPVSPIAPAMDPYMPQVQPAAHSSHYPQEYGQQSYSGQIYSDQSYLNQSYQENGFVAQEYTASTPAQYDYDSATAQQAAEPYAQSYAQTDYSQPASSVDASSGIYDNPYLSGQSQAGAINQAVDPLNTPYQS